MKTKLLSLFLALSLLIPLTAPLTAIAEDASTPAVETESVQAATETVPTAVETEIELARPLQGEAITENNLPFAMTESEIAEQGFVGRVMDAERDLHSIVMENADGSLTLHYYNHPVKYVDEDGNIRDKSDKLQASTDGGFETVASDIRTAFPKRLGDGITMQKGNHTLRMAPAENLTATGTLSADQTTVTYAVNARTYYEYSLTAMGFKEDIVVLAYTGQTEYSFTLQTGGLTAVNQYGTWVLVDEDNTIRANLSDVIVFTADERNNTFGELRVEEITAGQTYRLTVVLDADWLADPKTVYPITIDPSVDYANTTGNIEDLVVGTSTTYNGYSGSLYVGRGASGAKIRTLMRFPNLQTEILGYNVTYAQIVIRDLICESTAQTVQCYEYDGDPWTESKSIAWTAMGDSPLGDWLDEESVHYSGGNDEIVPNIHRFAFDITPLVQDWAAGEGSPANGIIFKATDDYETNGTKTFKTFASINRGSNQPTLTINYIPSITLSPSSSEIMVGETLALTATIAPADPDATISYTSSNNSIATVSDTGVVTGVSQGTVTITATDTAGNSATCTVKVNATSLEVIANRYYSAYTGNIQVGVSAKQPAGTTYTWTTSRSSIATISASGMLQFKNIGAVDVTVTASTGDTATKTFYGIYPDGVYKIQNVGSYKYATLENDRIVEDVNISQYRDQSEALKQLWRVHYIGDGEYVIRSMQNPSLIMAMDTVGNIKRNVKAENIGTSDDDLPDRVKWYFRGTTYSMFTEVTVNATIYQLAVAAGDTSDYGNIYAITSEGSGATSWRLVEIDTVAEGVLIYNRNENATGKTYYMNLNHAKQLTAIFYTTGEDISQTFTWTSNAPSVATVDEDTGLVYAVGTGTAKITATSTVDPRRSAYCYVSVDEDSDFDGIPDIADNAPIAITQSGFIMSYGDTCDHDNDWKYGNYDGSYCQDECQAYFSASYQLDFGVFLNSATDYQPTLAQTSAIAVTLAYHNRFWYDASNDTENENRDENDCMGIVEWLDYHGMIGAQRISISGDENNTDNHLSEIIMGYRPVVSGTKKMLVIAVIIRGTNGTIEEWSSNVDIGDTRDFLDNTNHLDWTNAAHHMGFDITSNRIIAAVTEYVDTRISSHYAGYSHTYWVTGHSRAGALANLTAAKLIDSEKNVFAYTFASPGTIESTTNAPHATKYDSIFNIVNADDFIPYFPLSQWNFTLYGRTTQNVSVSSSYSTLWKNSWENNQKATLELAYVKLGDPTSPLFYFYLVASSRNSCYEYKYDPIGKAALGTYPSNTEGYYLTEGLYNYHMPMFLMKYFVAVAAGKASTWDFVSLTVAPYLQPAKLEMIRQIASATGPEDIFEFSTMERLEYPHLPQSYYLLSMQCGESHFS